MTGLNGRGGEDQSEEKHYKGRHFSQWAKSRSHRVLHPLVRFLQGTGLHPNVLSMAGFLMAAASGVAVAGGKMKLGAWFFLLSGPFDALDGALARAAGLESRFGAFLDSFLDRYADAAVVIGIIFWASRHERHGLVAVSALALVGSVMVSYARARAEGLGMSCSMGLFTRLERFLLLVITLFSGQLLIGVVLLAVLSNVTAVQRLHHVYTQDRPT